MSEGKHTADSSDLIARLEKATGPDRGLDVDILQLVNPKEYDRRYWDRRAMRPRGDPEAETKARASIQGPSYTASIDAALTLVPKGYCWQVKQGIESEAIVWSITIDYDDDGAPAGYSTTFPAIALCIAALRARAAIAKATGGPVS